ncbi:hypothetical protein RI129_011167 [Pyrocoelia pectoralis]|uniref:snRNA-activating protein complex subunit 4 n=1 Tax=Pyrocoelia pectoralis TaxID=417401 RepID=A0AAN7ZH89_9COLE
MDIDCLEEELFELSELYPGDDGDSEDDFEKDLEEVNENSADVEGFIEKDYDVGVEGIEPKVQFNDHLLVQLKEQYGDTIFYNNEEENEVILSCRDKDLQTLLIKNRIRAKQLQLLHSNLSKILKGCVENVLSNETVKKPLQSKRRTYIWKLGIPYFKDKKFYSCPNNSDVKKMEENCEFALINLKRGRHWQSHHQALLQNTIEKLYYVDYLQNLNYNINICKVRCKNDNENVTLQNELHDLENELQEIESKEVQFKTPPLLCDKIDWHAVADAFKGSRTLNECKALWNIYLHPHINKTLWTAEENLKIKQLAKRYNCQKWDVIANKLGTNRSGYLVFLNYVTNLWSKFKTDRFTLQEDEKILNLVDKYRIGSYIPWRTISIDFKDRSKAQIYHRYKYYLVEGKTKGPFSEAEDIFVLHLVSKYGSDYRKCAEFLPNRTCIQIRNRYHNALSNDIKINRGNFTTDEDRALMDHVKIYGPNNWPVAGKAMGRNSTHVRQRYAYLRRWLSDPGHKLENIPRRQHELLYRHNLQRNFRIRKVAEQLQNRKEVDLNLIKELLVKLSLTKFPQGRPVDKKPKWSYYDHKIIDFLKGTRKVQRERKRYKGSDIVESVERIIKLLHVLSAQPSILENADLNLVSDQDSDILANMTQQNISSSSPPLKFMVPPTLNTVLGLRGLIVKYQLHKESPTKKPDSVPIKPLCEAEHLLFLKRFYALFKWPCIVSQFFPNQLEADDPKISLDDSKPKKNVGRPRKVVEDSEHSDVSSVLSQDTKRPPKKKRKVNTQVLEYKRIQRNRKVQDSTNDDTQDGDAASGVEEVCDKVDDDFSVGISNLPINNDVLLVDINTIKKLGSNNKNIIILDKNDVIRKVQVEMNTTEIVLSDS